MPITIKAPNGDSLNFPDGTDDATIEKVMGENYGSPSAPAKGTPAPAYTGQAGEVLKKGDTVDSYLQQTGRNVTPSYEGLTPEQKTAWEGYGAAGSLKPTAPHGSKEYPVMQVDNAELPGGTWYFDAQGALNQVPVKENHELGFLEGGAKAFNNGLHFAGNAAQAVGVPEDVVHKVGGMIRQGADLTGQINEVAGTNLPEMVPGKLMNQAQIDELMERARVAGERPSFAGELAGGVASSVPLAVASAGLAPEAGAAGIVAGGQRLLAGAGLQGGISGALNSENPDDLGGVARDAVIGAVTGKAGDVGIRATGAAVAPQFSAAVQRLADRGIHLTPGEMVGGGGAIGRTVQKVEDGMAGVPLIGDVIGGAKNHGTDTYNQALYRDIAQPLGINLGNRRAGRESISHLQTEVGNQYDQLIPSLTFRADRDLATDLNDVQNAVLQMPRQYQQNWRNLMQDRVGRMFDQTGTMTGRDFKDLESHMTRVAKEFTSSPDPFHRNYGQAVREALDSLRDNLARTNPQAADRLRTLNEAYSRLAVVEEASSNAGGRAGVFSPEQHLQAIKGATKGATRRRQIAGGSARDQQLAEDAMQVMGTKVHDTGAMARGAATLGVGGLALGMVPHGMAIQPLGIAALGGLATPYVPVTRDIVRNAMISRPAGADALRRAVTSAPARSIATAFSSNIPGAQRRTNNRKHVE